MQGELQGDRDNRKDRGDTHPQLLWQAQLSEECCGIAVGGNRNIKKKTVLKWKTVGLSDAKWKVFGVGVWFFFKISIWHLQETCNRTKNIKTSSYNVINWQMWQKKKALFPSKHPASLTLKPSQMQLHPLWVKSPINNHFRDLYFKQSWRCKESSSSAIRITFLRL